MRRNHRGDYSAFAMTDKTDFLGVDFLASFQIGDGGFGVAGKIFRRRVGVIASGLAVSTLIETKNGNAFSRQVIRQDEKWPMSNKRFIAVVRPGTAEENGRGKRTLAARESERACE